MIQTKEEYYKILNEYEIQEGISKRQIIKFKAKRPVLIGNTCLLKVNMNIGVSNKPDYKCEIEKLEKISQLSYRPDSMMDHTIVQLDKPLWKSMLEMFDGAVGTLPHYLVFDDKKGIDEKKFLENLTEMAESGVSFMTLHPTANLRLYKKAINSKRIVPTTSRGGFILLKDQVINKRETNLIASNFHKIMEIFSNNNVGVSIGTVFRPATIHEALDEFHVEETLLQQKYIEIAKEYNVPVIMEGEGHISLDKIPYYANLIREFHTPLMPLGPIPSDEIIGFDHVSNVIGALSMAQCGVVGMINSVTREEHTGKVPSYESVLEGLMSARVVAHSYNISRFINYRNATEVVGKTRAMSETCVQQGGIFSFKNIDDKETSSCTRCRRECPLKKIII